MCVRFNVLFNTLYFWHTDLVRKLIIKVFIVQFIVGCSGLVEFQAERGEQTLKNYYEIGIKKEYIESNSQNKVLIKTNIPVEVKGQTSWGHSSAKIYKYYYSLNKDSYEEAVLEASEYCHIDNPTFEISKFCIVTMVNDFNANEIEKEFGKYLMEIRDDYYELTTKNFNLQGNCSLHNYGTTENPNIKFSWKGCETNIRLKRELPKRMPKENNV